MRHCRSTVSTKTPRPSKLANASANGYHNVVFHRVIKGFMLQTGDRLAWARAKHVEEFQDEIVRNLKHDKPGVLSMANQGQTLTGAVYYVCCNTLAGWQHTVLGVSSVA